MPKYECKVKILITETSEIIEKIEVDAPDEVTADDDALTIANEMKANPQAWLDTPRMTTMENFEFEIIDTEEI
tara:strand:- start:67 stop:285 length:219 start_codon:yes stop_codon:yes gene_type:complete